MLYSCESEREFNTYLNKEIQALHFCSQEVSKCNGAAAPYGGREAGEMVQRLLQPVTCSQTLHSPSWGSVWGRHLERVAGWLSAHLLHGQRAPYCVGELPCDCFPESSVVRRSSKCSSFQGGSGFHPSCCPSGHTFTFRFCPTSLKISCFCLQSHGRSLQFKCIC